MNTIKMEKSYSKHTNNKSGQNGCLSAIIIAIVCTVMITVFFG